MAAILGAGIAGNVLTQGHEAYPSSRYQYAATSYPTIVAPAAIVYPRSDDDVCKAIAYAKQMNLGIAIRTGGHHYTGASSTSGANIQLDLSETYTTFYVDDLQKNLVTVGVSHTLSRFLHKLRNHNMFVPVGQCAYVYVGGHCQTGGYGQLIRSFGLFADTIQEIRVILASGEIRMIRRGVEADKDLFYGILGGSPGNFGVVTHLRLLAYRDEDHPKSGGIFGQVPYTPETFKDLLNIMIGLDEANIEGDYDYTLTILSAEQPIRPKPIIVIFVQWANLGGKDQAVPEYFQSIQAMVDALGKLEEHEGAKLVNATAPISTLCSYWVFAADREFQMPYHKRTYLTKSNAQELGESGWVDWVTDRLEALIHDPDCRVASQIGFIGGEHSAFRKKGENDHQMSFSWRDSTFCWTMDGFYTSAAGAEAKAKAWVDKNDTEANGPNGKFSKQDRRLLWGSHDTDLNATRAFYYDSEEKYNRLVEIKQKADAGLIFTSNKFAVAPHRP